MSEHAIDASRIDHHPDRDLEPTLQVASGDTVHFDLLEAGHGHAPCGSLRAQRHGLPAPGRRFESGKRASPWASASGAASGFDGFPRGTFAT
jgi:hypothetical protein